MKTIYAYGKWRKVGIANGYEIFTIPANFYPNGKPFKMYIHRWLWMQNYGPIPDGMDIHHKDENKLNNSLANLEIINHNMHIARHMKCNKYVFKGGSVIWRKDRQKWLAQARQDGKNKYLGRFLSQFEAYQALFEYDKAYWTPEKIEDKLKELSR